MTTIKVPKYDDTLIKTLTTKQTLAGKLAVPAGATGDEVPQRQEVDTAIAASRADHEAALDPHPQYTSAAEAAAVAPVQSVAGKTGNVALVAADVGGLGTMATQDASGVAITGGSVDGAAVGGTTPAPVSATNLSYTGTLIGGAGVINIGPGHITKDAEGNIGIGGSANPWVTNNGGNFDLGQGGYISGSATFGLTCGYNGYFDGTNWRYTVNTAAHRYEMDSGRHAWFTAPVGIAGGVISFTQAMSLLNNGNLLIGKTLDQGGKVQIQTVTTGGGVKADGIRINNPGLGGAGLDFQNSSGAQASIEFVTYDLQAGVFNDVGVSLKPALNGITGSGLDVDPFGNLNIKAPLRQWVPEASVLQAGVLAAFGQGRGGNADAVMSWNARIFSGQASGTGYVYNNTGDLASSYEQNGSHRWYVAPAGAADTAVPFNLAMTLGKNGNLLLGAGATDLGFRFSLDSGTLAKGLRLGFSGITSSNIEMDIDNVAAEPFIGAGANSNPVRYGTKSNTVVKFIQNDLERARLTPLGNIVVGSTVDSAPFKIKAVGGAIGVVQPVTSSHSLIALSDIDDGTSTPGFLIYHGSTHATKPNVFSIVQARGAALTTEVNGAERTRTSPQGYFKASPSGTYVGTESLFHEFYQTANSANVFARNTNVGAGAVPFLAELPTGAAGFYFQGTETGVAVRYQVAANGDVTNTNNSYGAISDITHKKDIATAPSYWEKHKAIRFVNYVLINDPTNQKLLGVIAQEMQHVLPGVVRSTPVMHDVEKTRPVRRTVAVTRKVPREQVKTTIEFIDGQYRRILTPEVVEVDEQIIDEFPLFDDLGQPVMEIDTPEQRDEEGNIVAEATYKQSVHKVPRTETVEVQEPYTEREPTGEVTLSIVYSVLSVISEVVLQEAQHRIEATETELQAAQATIASLLARVEALEAA